MSSASKKNLSLIIAIIIAVVCVAGLYLISKRLPIHTVKVASTPIKVHGIMLNKPRDIAPFTLTADNGQPFTLKQLKGHWSFMFFGFTHCPKVCPTTMAAFNKMYQTLQTSMSKSELPQVIMVSVDPDRDTVARMRDYVKAFNPHFIGLRGNMHALKPIEHALHVVALKEPSTDGVKSHYNMRHTASVMVIDPKGQLRGFLSYPHKASEMVADYKAIMKAYG